MPRTSTSPATSFSASSIRFSIQRKSRPESCELTESKQSLADIVEKAVRSVQAQAEKKQIDLSVRLPSPPISILGDEARLGQIAVNLLSNAVKFTPEHGRVDIAAELEENAGLCITIADTGIGMSADEIDCALELFRQVDNSFTKRFEGTGLGLPLACQFTKLHGGTLAIESAPGEGTKVFVRLPAERVVLDAMERPLGSNFPRDGVRKCGTAADRFEIALIRMYGPAVCCKRKTSKRRRWVLRQCIRPICGAIQQLLATMDISAHPI